VRFSDGKSSDEKAGGAGAVVFLTTPAPLTEELNGKLLETFVELPDCGRAKKDNVGNSGVGEIWHRLHSHLLQYWGEYAHGYKQLDTSKIGGQKEEEEEEEDDGRLSGRRSSGRRLSGSRMIRCIWVCIDGKG
jgi:hypothetical protein